ncbi:uncharacterized protein LOC111263746 [Varroa jacobsoni]|uniref:Uncharacterized protein n=1 Tax=Varroa destructor TaxID=109461 RepID=A0A7M7JM03_VARDE|nr:uncharacterized protein LOC111247024 [Varroa destructor]XP_022694853.1 uncharacterized protein LOC111263746 [Varroa jacobsoni]
MYENRLLHLNGICGGGIQADRCEPAYLPDTVVRIIVKMKTLVVALLASTACLTAADTATGDHQPDSNQFGRWRTCLKSKIPENKQPGMEACINKPGGTDMSKFRRGLGCVLESYGIVNNHRVDLTKMRSSASLVTSPELKKAFMECPKDDKNSSLDRSIKCVIDHLETSCSAVKAQG